MISVASVKTLVLDLPPSCIEFWPLNSQYAVAGTYNLEKSASTDESAEQTEQSEELETKKGQQRSGSLILLRVDGNDVEIIQTLATPSAILDIHFAPLHFPPSLFAVATSTGSISLYHLTDEYGNGLDTRKLIQSATSVPRLSHIKTCQFFSEDVLITAFSWHPLYPSVGVTLSSGEVCIAIVDVYPQTTFPPSDLIRAHDLEAWTLAFLPDASGVFSGGDDSVLGFAELPTGAEEPRLMPWLDRKIHDAGVTAILPLQVTEEGVLVLTGSYDDHIRLVHASATGRRRVLAEGNLGGGVWRLKRLDSEPGVNDVLLLVSCMHAGARIVKLHRDESGEWQFEVLAKFEEHKSMNYGSDSQPTLNEQGQRTFITTSFYDRLLCLWRY